MAYPLRDAIFPTRKKENGLCRGFFLKRAIFPFSRGKNRISQGVDNRGSLISVPLALRDFHFQNCIVMTFPMKNSVLDNFAPCPPAQAPLKSANFIFIVVSLSLIFCSKAPSF